MTRKALRMMILIPACATLGVKGERMKESQERGTSMKEKSLIFQGNPCIMPIGEPGVQTMKDLQERGLVICEYYDHRHECSPPRFGCVRIAGIKVARYLLLFYNEASDRTLAMELETFRRRAPLPPEKVEAYIDTPEYSYRKIKDPELAVERVAEYARAVLDMMPGERVFRSSEETPLLPQATEMETLSPEKTPAREAAKAY